MCNYVELFLVVLMVPDTRMPERVTKKAGASWMRNRMPTSSMIAAVSGMQVRDDNVGLIQVSAARQAIANLSGGRTSVKLQNVSAAERCAN